MSWDESRGGLATAARREAHADDAKHRVDETSRVPGRRFPKWAALAVAVVLLVVVGGGAAAALVSARDDDPRPAAERDVAGSGSGTGTAADQPDDPAGGGSEDPASTESLVFTAQGPVRTVFTGVEGGASQTQKGVGSVSLDCSAGPCTVTAAEGIPGVAGRTLEPAGDDAWNAGGTPAPADQGCEGDDFDIGQPSIDLRLVGDAVRMLVKAQGAVIKGQGCFRNIPNMTSTFNGTR